MMFFKLVKYDLRIGVLRAYKKYIVIAVLFTFFCIDFLHTFQNVCETYELQSSFTVGDIALFCFAGMEEYIPSPLEPFKFPVSWMLLYVALFYIILYYPYKDLTDFGQNILVRSGGRSLWWLSKCVWGIVSIVCFFATAFLTIIVFSLIAGAVFTTEISEAMPQALRLTKNLDPQFDRLFPAVFILPMAVSISLSLLQTTLSLLIKPLYSFAVMVCIMLASSYYFHPLMLGGYAMPVRNDKMITNGFSFEVGLIFSVIVAVSSILIGLVVFNRRDILKEEE